MLFLSPRISGHVSSRGYALLGSSLLAVLTAVPVFGHGALHERIESLVTQIEGSPKNAQLHFELADAYCRHEEWEKALAEVERTEDLASEKYPTAVVKAEALLGINQSPEAKRTLDSLLLKNPTNAKALFLRARALSDLGEVDASLADYRAALSIGRSTPEWFQEAAEAFTARGRSVEALATLNETIAKLGPIPSLNARAMELEIASGQFEAALGRVDVLQKAAVHPEQWMAKRAELLARLGRTGEARAQWETLQAHLAALPNLERGSRVMTGLAAKAEQALRALPEPDVSAAVADKNARPSL